MIKNITVVEDGDLVSHANSYMNIDWNKACDTLQPLRPNSHISLSEVDEKDEYGYGEECCNIVRCFMAVNDINEIYYVGHV